MGYSKAAQPAKERQNSMRRYDDIVAYCVHTYFGARFFKAIRNMYTLRNQYTVKFRCDNERTCVYFS